MRRSTSSPLILAANWYSLIIRGFVAIALGLTTLIWRGITTWEVYVVFFGYAMIDGLVNIAGALRAAQRRERFGVLLLEGLTGPAAAIVAASIPTLPQSRYLAVIAGWAFITGACEIVSAIELRNQVKGELLLALSGLASLALGTLMIVLPFTREGLFAPWIGLYAFIFGALLLALGVKLRAWVRMPRVSPG